MTLADCAVRCVTAGSNPDWSPDGRRIVFERFEHIWIVDAGGRHARRLTRGSGTGRIPRLVAEG
jgi:Tol biopolymer transport system component